MWYKNNMNLRARLAKLERNRPQPSTDSAGWLEGLPADLLWRCAEASRAGTFPKSLSPADIEVLMEAARGSMLLGARHDNP